jgi:3-hexulose-6-phosphate synthase/6-phospho-3-hexuloisomerase
MRRANARLARTEAKTRRRLLSLASALLSDALGKTGAMDHDMKCYSARAKMAGPAATLRVHPADVLMVAKAVALSPPGRVLVIDGQGELNTALWGSIITLGARRKGLAGVVIDGAIRDLAEIRRDPFPVFARAVVPNAGGAEYRGEFGVPVQCGGMVVNPGDWVVGDLDGVVVIPARRVQEALEGAERLKKVEKRIAGAVRAGKDLGSLLHCDQVLERKAAEAFLPQMRFTPE